MIQADLIEKAQLRVAEADIRAETIKVATLQSEKECNQLRNVLDYNEEILNRINGTHERSYLPHTVGTIPLTNSNSMSHNISRDSSFINTMIKECNIVRDIENEEKTSQIEKDIQNK